VSPRKTLSTKYLSVGVFVSLSNRLIRQVCLQNVAVNLVQIIWQTPGINPPGFPNAIVAPLLVSAGSSKRPRAFNAQARMLNNMLSEKRCVGPFRKCISYLDKN
jgi:hypothetical protein